MTQFTIAYPLSSSIQETVLLGGDLSKLTASERLSYYAHLCTSLGLNPLTRPFEYLVLNGKMVLYARKDCTEQLRTNKQISVSIVAREIVEGVYVVTARAHDPEGRVDESIGAVNIEGLKGDNRANAMMKAETKAKRRVTLSITGLGMLDETEVETIPTARRVPELRPIDEHMTEHQEATLADVQAALDRRQEDGLELQLTKTRIEATPPVSQDAPAPNKSAEMMRDSPPSSPNQPAFIWRIGKQHQGESVVTMDEEYLSWYKQNGKPGDHWDAADHELKRREAARL